VRTYHAGHYWQKANPLASRPKLTGDAKVDA
jgi:hypothetical protein